MSYKIRTVGCSRFVDFVSKEQLAVCERLSHTAAEFEIYFLPDIHSSRKAFGVVFWFWFSVWCAIFVCDMRKMESAMCLCHHTTQVTGPVARGCNPTGRRYHVDIRLHLFSNEAQLMLGKQTYSTY